MFEFSSNFPGFLGGSSPRDGALPAYEARCSLLRAMRHWRADLKVEGFAMAKDEQVSVRLPNELKIKLEKIAAAEDRPVASVIRRTLLQALQGQQQQHGAAA